MIASSSALRGSQAGCGQDLGVPLGDLLLDHPDGGLATLHAAEVCAVVLAHRRQCAGHRVLAAAVARPATPRAAEPFGLFEQIIRHVLKTVLQPVDLLVAALHPGPGGADARVRAFPRVDRASEVHTGQYLLNVASSGCRRARMPGLS